MSFFLGGEAEEMGDKGAERLKSAEMARDMGSL